MMAEARTKERFTMTQAEIFRFGNAEIINVSLKEAVDLVIGLCESKKPSYVVTPNVDHIVLLEDHKAFQESYAEADLVFCDGMPIVWASHLINQPLKERVAGSDLAPALCERVVSTGHSVFLFGAAPGVAERAAANLCETYPGITIAGVYSPPLGFDRDDSQVATAIQRINESNADLIFLAMSTISQETFMQKSHTRLNKGVMLGIGATIDFIAGEKVRAPVVLRKMGLEWAFRLAQEPTRLFGRYFRDLKFIPILMREVIRSWRRS